MNYYNEIDPKAAAWIRELIATKSIPYGDVDERSICDVQPSDLRGYFQCHFFAGIGGWPLALRLAGYPEGKTVWTLSCPCPPFSCAGKKKLCPTCGGKTIPHPLKTGFFACIECGHEWLADGRHLWPEAYRLLRQCRPAIAFGEQVAGEDGEIWISGVRACMAREGYGFGASDLPAGGIGAPHKRQRLYWVAYSKDSDWRSEQQSGESTGNGRRRFAGDSTIDSMADAKLNAGRTDEQRRGQEGRAVDGWDCQDAVALGDSHQPRLEGHSGNGNDGNEPGWVGTRETEPITEAGSTVPMVQSDSAGRDSRQSSTEVAGYRDSAESAGFWSNYRIIQTRDGKFRHIPTEPAFFPLANGIPARVVRLRGYGNAIVPPLAAQFIRASIEAINSI